MPSLFRRIGESEIDEAENQAFRHRVGCARHLAKPDWLIAPVGARSLRILAEGGREQQRHRNRQSKRENPPAEKLYVFGNKARDGRVSCLAAQFGAIWSRSAHRESVTWLKKA